MQAQTAADAQSAADAQAAAQSAADAQSAEIMANQENRAAAEAQAKIAAHAALETLVHSYAGGQKASQFGGGGVDHTPRTAPADQQQSANNGQMLTKE
ncbi:hypothetical protein WJ542_04065 [Paraburkholderia sp. B3]|uniref:hypothetical protein n=1 Tax=Paraburkholderia sp. B3 TaxID=3134791 RepID=UPI003981FE2E